MGHTTRPLTFQAPLCQRGADLQARDGDAPPLAVAVVEAEGGVRPWGPPCTSTLPAIVTAVPTVHKGGRNEMREGGERAGGGKGGRDGGRSYGSTPCQQEVMHTLQPAVVATGSRRPIPTGCWPAPSPAHRTTAFTHLHACSKPPTGCSRAT